MSASSAAGRPGGVDTYIDQVVRKEQFLAAHPEAAISTDPNGAPHHYWHGQVPGFAEVVTDDLKRLLDTLDYQVAARDAQVRWPNWTFSRSCGWWRAKQADGPELLTGRTLEQVEGGVAQWERIAAPPFAARVN